MNAAPSSLHSKLEGSLAEKTKLGDLSLLGLLGLPMIVAVGCVPSTTVLGPAPAGVNGPLTSFSSPPVHE